ncbi:MAG TPA: hypothetical protein VFE20_08160 [Thermoleophilia bacterium]|nr:hypothetical protein [Thermoleophilia bacterium]
MSVGLQSFPSLGNAEQLGLEVGVCLLEQLDGLIDMGGFHALNHDGGL